MSEQEQESMTERELADHLQETLYGGKASATETEEPEEGVEPEVEPAPEEPPVVVSDEPVQPAQPEPEQPSPEQPAGEPEEPEAAEAEVEDVHVVWATKRFGPDTAKWARAAHDQEQHISRLAAEKKEAEELAGQWYEYSQQVEANQPQVQMPLTAQEEQWADQAMVNPVQYAYQAVMNGNMGLYNAIIERVAYQDARQASAVETEVRLQVMAAAEAEAQEQNGQPPDLASSLGATVERAGIDVQAYGPAMMEKIEELGEFSPYVQAILSENEEAREMAFRAVYDMVRAGNLTTRTVRDDARDEKLKREGELRRQAAGVVTGGGSSNPPTQKPAFMQAMEDEWKARGQWSEE